MECKIYFAAFLECKIYFAAFLECKIYFAVQFSGYNCTLLNRETLYNPVSKEIAEILEKEGTLIVTGQPRNQFIKDILDMSSEELLTLGLEFMEKGPAPPSLIVGVPKTTTGKLLSTKVMIQVIYRKIK
ncbi:MAG: hypothetical protein DRR16_29640 [Candidatus Parabeggiatoa sp. nov. 3]|nr:MAG: hypothetical protein DRR00_18800 [Gammaproteobacteria bacterium]RKZ56402.1 MAG: hypothetical protein DRQ99_28555 [Gammaproteobacteria bacterium]RKZ77450.1 MAG: hypothetical protein DRR16_29640 [Gammaproteobacteria bacterium]